MMTGCDPPGTASSTTATTTPAAGRMKVNHSGRVRVPTVWQQLSAAGLTDRLPEPARHLPPLERRRRRRLGHGRAAPRGGPVGGRPNSRPLEGRGARATAEGPLEARPGRSLEELKANAATATAASLPRPGRGGCCSPTAMSPTGRSIMVQFQNLDPFQHRAWKYLNVDETGSTTRHDTRRPRWSGAWTRPSACSASSPTAGGRGCWPSATTASAPAWAGSRSTASSSTPASPAARWAGQPPPPRSKQAADRLRRWSAKRRDPSRPLGLVRRRPLLPQFPFDWKRTLAFVPHQDTAAMVYVNCRSPGGSHTAPLHCSLPARSTTPTRPRRRPSARPVIPRQTRPFSPRSSPSPVTYQLDPAPRASPTSSPCPTILLGSHAALPGRSWVMTDPPLPAPTAPTASSPSPAAARPGPLGSRPADRRHSHDPELAGLPFPAHVEGSTDHSGTDHGSDS